MVSQRCRRDTEVPPNLSTIQGEGEADTEEDIGPRMRVRPDDPGVSPDSSRRCRGGRGPSEQPPKKMSLRRYLQLDVFADRPGAGNPLGVVLEATGLDDNAMQAFAAWTNLSETIFLLPPGANADYRVRIFTPRQELPFAGHP